MTPLPVVTFDRAIGEPPNRHDEITSADTPALAPAIDESTPAGDFANKTSRVWDHISSVVCFRTPVE